jgi:hypothetical protein
MEYLEALRQAAAVVEDASLPADLRPQAFAAILERILGEGQPTIRPPRDRRADKPEAANAFDTIAAKAGLEVEAVERVFEFADGNLTLAVPRSRLPKGKGPAARAIAIAVAAGNQIGLGKDWTPIAVIRELSEVFGVLDPKNFASYVRADGELFIGRLKDTQRELKLTRHGLEEATRLIKSLAGGA